MGTKGFASSKEYWVKFGWGVFIGMLTALSVLFFNYLMNLGLKLLWPGQPAIEPFSGSWQIVLILTAAGFIVGLIYHFMEAKEVGVVEILTQDRVDIRPIPGGLLVSLVSLIGGFSVGPEVPSAMIGAWLAAKISDARKLSDEIRKSNMISSLTAAYGGLFTSPFGAILIPIEVPHVQSIAFVGTMIIATAASVVGFALFYFTGGNEFAGLLRILDLPMYDLQIWHLLVAVVLGLLGAGLAVIFVLSMGTLKQLVVPLNHRPILRNTLAGLLLGLLGFALPLTLFLGSDGLVLVTENAAEIGVALLIVYVFAKILATAGAISTGFIGGPIFPLFFVGGTMGTAVTLLFPDIPIALSVGCLMVAVTAGVLPIPISLGVYVILIVGLPITEAIPILIAALTSFLVIKGFGLLSPSKRPAAEKIVKDDGNDNTNTKTIK